MRTIKRYYDKTGGRPFRGRGREGQIRKISRDFVACLPLGYVIVDKRTKTGCPYVRIWAPGFERYGEVAAGSNGSFIIEVRDSAHLLAWMRKRGIPIPSYGGNDDER